MSQRTRSEIENSTVGRMRAILHVSDGRAANNWGIETGRRRPLPAADTRNLITHKPRADLGARDDARSSWGAPKPETAATQMESS